MRTRESDEKAALIIGGALMGAGFVLFLVTVAPIVLR